MIWLVLFIWIFLLKSLLKSPPGCYQIADKENPQFLLLKPI